MKKLLTAFAALALSASLALATTTTTTTTLPDGQSARKHEVLTASAVLEDDSTAVPVLVVATQPDKVYTFEYTWLAREQAGTDQGKGVSNHCLAVAENIAGVLTVSAAGCGTAKGSLTIGSVAAASDGGKNFIVTATGNAAPEVVSIVVKAAVTVNDAPNKDTTTTTTSTTTTTL